MQKQLYQFIDKYCATINLLIFHILMQYKNLVVDRSLKNKKNVMSFLSHISFLQTFYLVHFYSHRVDNKLERRITLQKITSYKTIIFVMRSFRWLENVTFICRSLVQLMPIENNFDLLFFLELTYKHREMKKKLYINRNFKIILVYFRGLATTNTRTSRKWLFHHRSIRRASCLPQCNNSHRLSLSPKFGQPGVESW